MKLKNEHIVGIAGALGIAYYVFFCKKKPTGAGATDETTGGGGGGGIGGGGFAPPTGLVVLQTPPPPAPTATPSPMVKVSQAISDALGSNKPVAASTSSTSAGAQSGVGVTNTGGIKGIGTSTSTGTGGFIPASQGGSTVPQYSTGTVTQSQMSTGLQGGTVFKPFSGKGALTIDNLLM